MATVTALVRNSPLAFRTFLLHTGSSLSVYLDFSEDNPCCSSLVLNLPLSTFKCPRVSDKWCGHSFFIESEHHGLNLGTGMIHKGAQIFTSHSPPDSLCTQATHGHSAPILAAPNGGQPHFITSVSRLLGKAYRIAITLPRFLLRVTPCW